MSSYCNSGGMGSNNHQSTTSPISHPQLHHHQQQHPDPPPPDLQHHHADLTQARVISTPTSDSSHHTTISSSPPSRPPTAGGGPLTSHPTTDRPFTPDIPPRPFLIPRARRPPHMDHRTTTTITTTTTNKVSSDSTQTPTSSSFSRQHNDMHSATTPNHRPNTIRRLFSLNSLRQSFSSSRTSFGARPDTSHGTYRSSTNTRPESPSIMSTTAASTAPPAEMASQQQLPTHTLRKRRSSGWFIKRKSSFVGPSDGLDVLREDGPEHKRFKDTGLPVLPEISSLSGGLLDGGHLGWDERVFQSVDESE